MRLTDEKLRVYSRIVNVIGDLPSARADVRATEEATEPYNADEIPSIADLAERKRVVRLFERHKEALQEAYNLAAELVTLANALRIWAPRDVTRAALALNDAHRHNRDAEAEKLETALIKAIRADLHVDSISGR